MFSFGESRWIWAEGVPEVNVYLQFKRILSLPKGTAGESAVIELAVDSDYALYINGRFVNCGQYQFGKDRLSVERLDVSSYLREGENLLCFRVYFQGASSSQYVRNQPGLIYCLKCGGLAFWSDETTFCRLDPCYYSGEYSRITRQLGFNFLYDASGEDDWLSEAEMDASWKQAACTRLESKKFFLRPIPKCVIGEKHPGKLAAQGFVKREKTSSDIAVMMQNDYLSSARREEVLGEDGFLKPKHDSDGMYLLYDLGEETVGYFYLDAEAPEGTVFDFSYGEHLEDLRVRAKVGGRNFANRYRSTQGRQCFVHRFTRVAGRYLQIHVMGNQGRIRIYGTGLIPVEYPLRRKAEIEFRDSLYRRIYNTAARTLHLCMHEHYEDTPWREQALYAMDSRNQALFGYYCFGEYEFPKASFRLLGDSLRSDGYLPITAPNDGPLTIPYFSMMWVVELYEYTLFSGDFELAEQYLPQTERMLDSWYARQKNGLPCPPEGKQYWNFYDWAEGLSGEGEEIPELHALYPMFLILAMQAHDQMAGFCTGESKNYREQIQALRRRVHELFWDEKKRLYATYRNGDIPFHYAQLTQALSLIAGVCPKEEESALRERMVFGEGLVPTTVSHSVFKIQALLPERRKYLSYVSDMLENTWGGMLCRGATSFWETEQGAADFDGAGSLSHGWSAVPVYILFVYLLGIYPQKPGFARSSFDPIGEKIVQLHLPVPEGFQSFPDGTAG